VPGGRVVGFSGRERDFRRSCPLLQLLLPSARLVAVRADCSEDICLIGAGP